MSDFFTRLFGGKKKPERPVPPPFLRGVPETEHEQIKHTYNKLVGIGMADEQRRWTLHGIVAVLGTLNSLPPEYSEKLIYELHKLKYGDARYELYFNLLNFFVDEHHDGFMEHLASTMAFVELVKAFLDRTFDNGSQTPQPPEGRSPDPDARPPQAA